ncbi:MAG: TRAP transporter large permease subunit, partial [Boseongicola sp. SB0675_bin_26]|nr:TRAP transporter large permease subunit [Boseongicola sp. SB0675_bin_26]
EMFLGAFAPGIVLVLLYMAFILGLALIRPKLAPAVPYGGARDAKFLGNALLTLVPPLALIFLVLGSILSGIATVNQAGAIGASGALIMAGYRLVEQKRLTFAPALLAMVGLAVIAFALSTFDTNVKAVIVTGGDMTGVWLGGVGVTLVMIALVWSGVRVLRIENTLRNVMIETAKTTSLVFIILLGAAMLTAAFRAFGGEELVKDFLNSLPGGFWTQFVIVMAVIFVLGFFLDFIEIAVVVVPIVAPILLADPTANITAVWLGVMIGLNIQTSFLTPPFGFALFYLRGVAPSSVKTVQIYKGVVAFICLQLIALGIVGYYPQLVNYLPNRVSLLGETAPPPRNPKLQHCLEGYVHARLDESREVVLASIETARGLDLSVLPRGIRSDLADAFDNAEAAIGHLDGAWVAHDEVVAATDGYRPQHRRVRFIEKQIRDLDREIKELTKQASFLTSEDQADRKVRLEERVAETEAERAELAATLPDDWDEVYAQFSALVQAEDKARAAYRRAADDSVGPARTFLSIMDANDAFFALERDLRGVQGLVATGDRAVAEESAKALGSAFGALAGADEIRSALSKVRRSLREGREDREKAAEDWSDAVAAFEAQIEWRRAAAGDLSNGVRTYLEAISDTVGARQQERLNRDQALHISGCIAAHRDISLNF